jgi:hypothetical protein
VKLPKYWRPATKSFSVKLNPVALNYLRSQAEKHDVTQVFWINCLLTKLSKTGKNFNPKGYFPTEDEMLAVGIAQLSKDERERAKRTNFGAVHRPRAKRRRRVQSNF